jgi:hypothetical protein
MNQQLEESQAKQGAGSLAKLMLKGDTWSVS